eukprot:372233-Prymnesium_polylepis.3
MGDARGGRGGRARATRGHAGATGRREGRTDRRVRVVPQRQNGRVGISYLTTMNASMLADL